MEMLGSSPRVWGQVTLSAPSQPVRGIIPTRVGTRIPNNRVPSLLQDHPHACGDKEQLQKLFSDSKGSSPRVWGQEEYFDKAFNAARIIPTRVGTSSFVKIRFATNGDHPHACGDKELYRNSRFGK